MPILGLKTLPVNHPMHRVYQVAAGVLGVVLVVLGVVLLLASGEKLVGLSTSPRFAAFLIGAGVVLVAGMIAGGNVAAHVNAYVGAAFIAVGLASLLVLRRGDANLLQVAMTDLIVLFVIAMLLLAAGFYGQVGAASPHDVDRPRDTSGDPARAADTADLEG